MPLNLLIFIDPPGAFLLSSFCFQPTGRMGYASDLSRLSAAFEYLRKHHLFVRLALWQSLPVSSRFVEKKCSTTRENRQRAKHFNKDRCSGDFLKVLFDTQNRMRPDTNTQTQECIIVDLTCLQRREAKCSWLWAQDFESSSERSLCSISKH